MENEVIETRVARIWLGKDGIVRLIYILDNTELTRADAEENIVAIAKAGGGRKRLLLADIRKIKSADRESRVFSASAAAVKVITALAIFISSPVGKVLGNIFMRINNPPYPTRLFTSEAEAIEWLKGFIE